jgi:hypothetical protein
VLICRCVYEKTTATNSIFDFVWRSFVSSLRSRLAVMISRRISSRALERLGENSSGHTYILFYCEFTRFY